jgi:uncharacterized protein
MTEAGEIPESPAIPAENAVPDVETVLTEPMHAVEALPTEEWSASPTVIKEFLEPVVPIPGPGLLEAVGWMFLVFGLHVIGGIAAIVWIAFVEVTQTGSTASLRTLGKFTPEQWLTLAAGEQLVVTVLTLVLVAVRLEGRLTQRLNLARPTLPHAVTVALLMFPLSVLCSEFYRINQVGWKWLGTLVPVLQKFDELSSVEMMSQIAGAAGLDLLILVLAVCPAINEELIFRGLLGRGLTARRGWLPGVLMCSVMFGIVHLHPSHAAAVIPLGVAMHFIYITTRSLWGPVLLHFLNNTWAAVAAKLSAEASVQPEQAEQPAPLLILLLGALTAWSLGMVLWKSRIRYLRPDGSEWSPGYPTVEAPDEGVARRQMSRIGVGRFVLAGVVAVVFHVLLYATESAPKEPVQEQPAGRVGD